MLFASGKQKINLPTANPSGTFAFISAYRLFMFLHRALRFLMVLAVASLVLNDVVRLSCPDVFQTVFVQRDTTEDDENSNPTNTIFEEEVKHKELKERIEHELIPAESELDATVAHLISDDDVRHLAFLPIFTPPPDRA